MRHVVIPVGGVNPSRVNTDIGETVKDTITMSDGLTEIVNTPEAIKAYHDGKKAALRAAQEAQAKRLALNTGRRCPLQFDESAGHARECKADCVFYAGDSCVFSAQEATADTVGRSCPFMRRCVKDCALYRDGCTMRRE